MTDRRLIRHLVLAVLLKLALLVGLWWAFVHDAMLTVDTDTAARHLVPAPASATPGAQP